MSSNAILKCQNIWKKINHNVIIKNLTLDLYEGDILGLICKNNIEKDTIINLLLGTTTITGGTLEISGYDIKKHLEKTINNIKLMPIEDNLYVYLSGYENLKNNNPSEERIKEVVEIVDLKDLIHEKVKKYTKVMYKQLQLAISILTKPKIVVLDNPLNELDKEEIKKFINIIKYIQEKEKITILIISHTLNHLENICTRICIFLNGKILKDTTTKELKKIINYTTYIIEVNKTSLENILYQYDIIDSTHIKIKTTKEKINNIIKTLLLNEIQIYEIIKEIVPLEKLIEENK